MLILATSFLAHATPDPVFITCLRAHFGELFHSKTRLGPRLHIMAEPETRAAEDIGSLTVFNYNMQQFKNLRKVYRKHQGKSALLPLDHMGSPLREQIELIARDRPDIAFLQEIESGVDDLADVSMIHLNDDYRVVLMPSVNGTSQAWLLRRDLPFDFEIQSHINVPDPSVPNQTLFVRDLPLLTARLKGASPDSDPLFSMLGVHYKSMGGSTGDKTGIMRRSREIRYTAEVVQDLEGAYGQDYPVLVLGDFNTNIPTATELGPLRSLGFSDAFALQAEELRLIGKPVPPLPITHAYFKKKGSPPKYTQLDGQLLSGGMSELDALIRVYVNPYIDKFGLKLDPPKTAAQRKGYPSDHFAVSAEYSFKKILERFLRKNEELRGPEFPLDKKP